MARAAKVAGKREWQLLEAARAAGARADRAEARLAGMVTGSDRLAAERRAGQLADEAAAAERARLEVEAAHIDYVQQAAVSEAGLRSALAEAEAAARLLSCQLQALRPEEPLGGVAAMAETPGAGVPSDQSSTSSCGLSASGAAHQGPIVTEVAPCLVGSEELHDGSCQSTSIIPVAVGKRIRVEGTQGMLSAQGQGTERAGSLFEGPGRQELRALECCPQGAEGALLCGVRGTVSRSSALLGDMVLLLLSRLGTEGTAKRTWGLMQRHVADGSTRLRLWARAHPSESRAWVVWAALFANARAADALDAIVLVAPEHEAWLPSGSRAARNSGQAKTPEDAPWCAELLVVAWLLSCAFMGVSGVLRLVAAGRDALSLVAAGLRRLVMGLLGPLTSWCDLPAATAGLQRGAPSSAATT